MVVADLDLDALEADASQKLAELEQAESRLALDALRGDEDARDELKEIASERASIERDRALWVVARVEQERLDAEADSKAKVELEALVLERCGELDARFQSLTRLVDDKALELAQAFTAVAAVAEERRQELARIGRKGLPVTNMMVSAAILAGFRAADAPVWMERGLAPLVKAEPLAAGERAEPTRKQWQSAVTPEQARLNEETPKTAVGVWVKERRFGNSQEGALTEVRQAYSWPGYDLKEIMRLGPGHADYSLREIVEAAEFQFRQIVGEDAYRDLIGDDVYQALIESEGKA